IDYHRMSRLTGIARANLLLLAPYTLSQLSSDRTLLAGIDNVRRLVDHTQSGGVNHHETVPSSLARYQGIYDAFRFYTSAMEKGDQVSRAFARDIVQERVSNELRGIRHLTFERVENILFD